MKENKLELFRPSLLSVFILFLLLGFLLGTQIRLQQRAKPLEEMSDSDLGQLTYQISVENDALRRDLYELEIRLLEYEMKETSQKEILKRALDNLERVSVLSGLKKISGKGVEIKIEDEQGVLKTIDFLDLINELKTAGAEAIAVNGVRLALRDYISLKDSILLINGKEFSFPVFIRAIGNPQSLEGALVLPGGIAQTLSALEGVRLTITKKEELTLPSATLLRYNYARFE